MKIIESIMKNTPNWIDWDAPILKALIGKKDYRANTNIEESKDYNCGAVANELEFFYSKIKKEAKNRDFSQSRSDLLEYFSTIITGEKKLLNENDNSYIKRLRAFNECGEVETRTTKEALTAFLSYFYPWVSIMEGMENEPGIDESFSSWKLNDCEIISEKKSFTEKVLKMIPDSHAEKSFTGLKTGYRLICFFTKSQNVGELGSVTINGIKYPLSCDDKQWQQHSFLVRTDGSVNIKIEATADFMIDYFHLFKEETPCFTVLLQKQTSLLDVADDEAVISSEPLVMDDEAILSREPLVVDATANYTAKGKVKGANWNYFIRTDSITEQNEDWVTQKLNVLKAKGVRHKVIEVKI